MKKTEQVCSTMATKEIYIVATAALQCSIFTQNAIGNTVMKTLTEKVANLVSLRKDALSVSVFETIAAL